MDTQTMLDRVIAQRDFYRTKFRAAKEHIDKLEEELGSDREKYDTDPVLGPWWWEYKHDKPDFRPGLPWSEVATGIYELNMVSRDGHRGSVHVMLGQGVEIDDAVDMDEDTGDGTTWCMVLGKCVHEMQDQIGIIYGDITMFRDLCDHPSDTVPVKNRYNN